MGGNDAEFRCNKLREGSESLSIRDDRKCVIDKYLDSRASGCVKKGEKIAWERKKQNVQWIIFTCIGLNGRLHFILFFVPLFFPEDTKSRTSDWVVLRRESTHESSIDLKRCHSWEMFKRKTKEEITVSSSMRVSSLHVAYIATGQAEKEWKIYVSWFDRSMTFLINDVSLLSYIWNIKKPGTPKKILYARCGAKRIRSTKWNIAVDCCIELTFN